METVSPTTPPRAPVLPAFPESTPHSRGSAAHAQTLVDERAGNPKNIENVAYDLKSRERCSFITMLKALMLRQIMMEDKREDFKATSDDSKFVDLKFKGYLDKAVKFVNGHEGEFLRERLQAYCDTPGEKARYSPIVDVLNEILLYFRNLKSRGDELEDEDIIFAINDPTVVESYHLGSDKSTKRKPDLICLLAKLFRSFHEDCDSDPFHACVIVASDPKDKTPNEEAIEKANWGDILQSWELVSSGNVIKSEIRTDFKADEFLGTDERESLPFSAYIDRPSIASTSQVKTSAASGSKRKRGSENIPSSKKAKVDESLSILTPRAPKDVQCAFYGIERLRHSMDITHSMVVFLNDAKLTLSWYDSQGCIETDPTNIVDELPLLFTMIGIFEDFPLGMWGYTPIDIWTEDETGKKVPYNRKENPVGSFQIIGRRTFTADATKNPIQGQVPTTPITASDPLDLRRKSDRLKKRSAQSQPSSASNEQPEDQQSEDEQPADILFLKSAWPETKRRKEPEVITEAYKRAKKLLGMEARSVTDHLPVLFNSKELAYTSTEIIRRLVKSTVTDGFRVQLWMLSKKLQPIHALDPSDFWTAFWHTLRCHALLWRIGIAHGDVSLHNLMFKEDSNYGVLNDFDLSTIMKPGDRNPNRQGLERTGTLPFMAMELLDEKGFDGKIPRRYDHELESFAWVLVWVSRCIVSGEECQRPRRLKEWLDNSNEKVLMSKLLFIRQQEEIPTTPDYEKLGLVTGSWIYIWNDYQQQLAKRSRILFNEKSNEEHLQALISACTECAIANPLASVPIDTAWVNGLADLKFTTPVRIPELSPDPTAVDEQLPHQRSANGSSPSDSCDSDDDMYLDDDGASLPNDTDFYETDGDDGRSSDAGTDN